MANDGNPSSLVWGGALAAILQQLRGVVQPCYDCLLSMVQDWHRRARYLLGNWYVPNIDNTNLKWMDHTNWLEIGTTKETKGNMLRYSKARKAFAFRSEKGQIQGSEHCMTTYPVKTGRLFFWGGGASLCTLIFCITKENPPSVDMHLPTLKVFQI